MFQAAEDNMIGVDLLDYGHRPGLHLEARSEDVDQVIAAGQAIVEGDDIVRLALVVARCCR